MKIIAEVGSNWNSLDDCKNSITLAKIAGADAVKFQLYSHKSLYGYDEEMPMWELPKDWIPILRDYAAKNEIEFMCTAFSPEEAEWVNQFVHCHKIASAEMLHIPLLKTINEFKKPVYLSTGAHNLQEIAMALNILKDCEVTVMHCVSSYPANDANLGRIELLRKSFNLPVGYSDHTTDITTIPALAVHGFGVTCLEKHFKFTDKISPKTPDLDHSLNPAQFERMVKTIRKTDVQYLRNSPDEMDMILKHNRRLVAIKDIEPGDILTEGVNFGCYRSKIEEHESLAPWFFAMVNGSRAKEKIKIGYPIKKSCLEMEENYEN